MSTVLSNPLRPVLLAAARNPRLERTVSRLGVTRKLVNRFVPGASERAVVAAVTDLLASVLFLFVVYLCDYKTDHV